jgi:hypothetical protein
MSRRWVSPVLWLLAVLLTLAVAVFQRLTGPSWPARGTAELAGAEQRYRLPRSHAGDGDLVVRLTAPADTTGRLLWRRYPTDERFNLVPLTRDGDRLTAAVPHQPPAGKVEYRVILARSGRELVLPPDGTAVARFRGAVPALVLIPHILAMFGGMLLATRALLGALARGGDGARGTVLATTTLLVVGGLVLGPIVQKYAFGAFWTGWPLGTDLTDTKTLVAVLGWLPATVAFWRRRSGRALVVVGWVVMMGVFLIPHSMFGSQLDWADTPAASSHPNQ